MLRTTNSHLTLPILKIVIYHAMLLEKQVKSARLKNKVAKNENVPQRQTKIISKV